MRCAKVTVAFDKRLERILVHGVCGKYQQHCPHCALSLHAINRPLNDTQTPQSKLNSSPVVVHTYV